MDDITRKILDELKPNESISMAELERRRREILAARDTSQTPAHPLETLYRDALTRAETLRELADKRHDEWRDACDERDAALAHARAETARAAELEVALAELQFRPMTETPPRAGLYEVAEFLDNSELYEIDHALWGENGWEEGNLYTDPSRMTHYRPIPRPLPPSTGEEVIAP